MLLAVLVVMFFSISAAAETFKMRISHQLPDTHHIGKNVNYFAQLVEEKTEGQVQVEVYPAAQAFKPRENIKAVATGGIEAALAINFQWAGTLPIMDVVLIPWLLTDLEQIDKALNGEPGKILFDKIASKGVVPLMWLLQCRTNIYTSNDEPLIMPEDFKNKKMRGTSKIMNIPSEALGASTMSISGPEVYMALQRGTIDIGLTGVDAALARHYYEVQEYGTVVNNFTVLHLLFLNTKFWNSLPAELQDIIQECGKIVQKQCILDSEKAKEEAVAALKEKMTIHIQTPEEAEAWKAVMQPPALEYFLEKTGEEGKHLVELLKQ
jgi:C4-dicarboxylate-binding protein DctP